MRAKAALPVAPVADSHASDALEAAKLLQWARANGFAISSVTVGAVSLEALDLHGPAPVQSRRKAGSMTDEEARSSLYAEYGGDALLKLEQMGSTDDDEDEPTVPANG